MAKVRESAVLDVPVDEAWHVLRDFNSHDRWHPAIAASRIEDDHSADEVGAVRAFSLKDGGFLREQLIRLDDRSRSFTYCLLESPIPLFDYVATVTLKPVTETGQTFWTWESRFRTPPGREGELVSLVAKDIYRAGMRGLETWLRRGGAGDRAAAAVLRLERSTGPTPRWTPEPVPARVSTATHPARAIVMQRHGGPEVLEYREVEVPPPGPGEVRIRQTCIGVNFIDIYSRSGYFDLIRTPGIPGMEAAGEVIDVGADVSELRSGDRVAYACAPTGAYASERTMAAELVMPMPAALTDERAAAGLLKGVSAAFLLHDVHAAREGETAIVHAAAGGVGSLLVQWARALGLRVIATVSTHDKAGRARALGAHEVIVGRGREFVETVMEITQGRGADVIYDAVGRDSFEFTVAALALRGHLVSYGQASGDIGARDIGSLASRSVTLSRPNYGHYTATRDLMRLQTRRLLDALDAGMLVIEQPRVFPLAQAAEAHRLLESGQSTGSLVLKP